jgi:hypothetical protein
MRGEGLAPTQALDLAKERQPACRVGVGISTFCAFAVFCRSSAVIQ